MIRFLFSLMARQANADIARPPGDAGGCQFLRELPETLIDDLATKCGRPAHDHWTISANSGQRTSQYQSVRISPFLEIDRDGRPECFQRRSGTTPPAYWSRRADEVVETRLQNLLRGYNWYPEYHESDLVAAVLDRPTLQCRSATIVDILSTCTA